MEPSIVEFEQVIEKGYVIDVHKETAIATVQGKGIKTETRTYNTFTSSLTEMKSWFTKLEIIHVAMESTRVYW